MIRLVDKEQDVQLNFTISITETIQAKKINAKIFALIDKKFENGDLLSLEELTSIVPNFKSKMFSIARIHQEDTNPVIDLEFDSVII